MAELQIDMASAIDDWAKVTIERFKEAIGKYRIGHSDGPLLQSFTYELIRSGGNVDAVQLKFRQYGRFWDMRVGRNLPLGNRKRKKAPWYSKTKTREVAVLREILVRDYGINTLAQLEQALTSTQPVTLT